MILNRRIYILKILLTNNISNYLDIHRYYFKNKHFSYLEFNTTDICVFALNISQY